MIFLINHVLNRYPPYRYLRDAMVIFYSTFLPDGTAVPFEMPKNIKGQVQNEPTTFPEGTAITLRDAT